MLTEMLAKRAEAAKQTTAKKGWGFTSWFGGAKKDGLDASPSPAQNGNTSSNPNKPIRAKLGEANSFYYDPELKRWVNKNAGPEDLVKKATPPPPKSSGGAPRSVSASPAMSGAGFDGRPHTSDGPPRSGGAGLGGGLGNGGIDSLAPPPPGPVAMLRSVSNTSTASAPPLGQHTSAGAFGTSPPVPGLAGPGGPTPGGPAPGGRPPRSSSRPPTSLSNSSSIDDLLSAAGPRKPGAAKKAKRGARYVDVMGKS